MKSTDLRIIFMGTPEFAVATLRALVEGGYNVVAVVTQPDKAVGRHGSVLQPSEVKQYAIAHELPVLQPERMKDPDFLSTLRSFNADLQVVVAFRMLPEVVWAMPPLGTFNVHAALLPQYRGAAPINWAVINGETLTGVTTFFLDHDIDTGRIIEQRSFPIPDDADAAYVYDGLMHLGADIAVSTINKIAEADGVVDSIPQDALPTYDAAALHPAPKIFKETCRLSWVLPAKQIYDFIRGLSPYPGAWTTLHDMPSIGNTAVLKVFRAAKTQQPATGSPGTLVAERSRLFVNTADYLLELLEVQLAGKKRMDVKSFLNGIKDIEGKRME